MIIDVSKHQAAFINANTRGRIFLSNIGGGKTRVMCYAALLEAIKQRYSCIVSFNYRNLKDVVLRTLKECADQWELDYEINISDMTFSVNGIPILLRSADNHDKLRSYNLHSFFIEEAREVTNEVFEILLGRLRMSEDCFWGLVSTCRGKNWFYDIIRKEDLEYIFNDDQYLVKNQNLTVVRCTIDDSPFLPKAYIEDLKRVYSTSFQQQELYAKIVETDGGIIDTKWFNWTDTKIDGGIRMWDMAATIKDKSDFSSSCHLSKSNGKYYINNMSNDKLSYPDLRRLIIETATKDGTNVKIGFEAAGQQQMVIDDLRRAPELSMFTIKTFHPTKDKLSRAYPVASQIEMGNFYINNDIKVKKEFLSQCSTFNKENIEKSRYKDDMIDALTGAYHLLNNSGPTLIGSIG
jgi:predicted phage terminase large subunit-like protein